MRLRLLPLQPIYREWVPSWELGYRLPLGKSDLIGLRYNGSWHSTENETFQLFRDDLNDRWSQTLSLVWTRLFVSYQKRNSNQTGIADY